MSEWVGLVNGAARLFFQSVGKWPAGQRFFVRELTEEPELDPMMAAAAVNGLGEERELFCWIVAETTAWVLSTQMHRELVGDEKVIALTTKFINDELLKVAGDPLRWVWFSFPWGEGELRAATRFEKALDAT